MTSASYFGLGCLILSTAVVVWQKPANAAPPRTGSMAPVTGPKPLKDTLTGTAKDEYEAAKILFDDGDFKTAELKFREAFAKQTDPRLLWNIAACEKNGRRYAASITSFRRYLTEASSLLRPEDRRDAEEIIHALEPLTAPITVTTSEDGADVWLDDDLLGVSPITTPVIVDVGTRKLRVTKTGFRPVERTVVIAKSEALEASLVPLRATLRLVVSAGATVTLDGNEVGKGPLLELPNLRVGPHLLRVTAPKMVPYQDDIALEDGKTREVKIELQEDPELIAEIRVAVGCRDPRILTPSDGLTVFIDGSAESMSALGVRKRTVRGRDEAAYVPFIVTPGRHRVTAFLPRCDTLSVETVALPHKPGVVEGMLPPSDHFFEGTPSGSPNGFRLDAGLHTGTIHFRTQYSTIFFPNRTKVGPSSEVDVGMIGPVVGGGLQLRWLTILGHLRYTTGSTHGTPAPMLGQPLDPAGSASNDGSFWSFDVSTVRAARFPIRWVSIVVGESAAMGSFNSSTASGDSSRFFVRVSGFAGVEVKPFCDWGIELGGTLSAFVLYPNKETPEQREQFKGSNPFYQEEALQVRAVYAPNRVCRRKRDGEYRLSGSL